MKKILIILLTIIISFSNLPKSFASTDELIYKDAVANVYFGTDDAKTMITNLNFRDISPDFWAAESIARAGALDIVKGYDKSYSPETSVTNEEAIAFVIRMLGKEKEAQQRATEFLDQNIGLKNHWSLGYIALAKDLSILSEEDYLNAIAEDQTQINPDALFARMANAKREDIALYIKRGLDTIAKKGLPQTDSVQSILQFKDYEMISADKVDAVEIMVDNKIMLGDSSGYFNPKDPLTRAEMAQLIKNMDSVYYDLREILRKTGTIAGLKDLQKTTTESNALTRDLYVRTQTGQVDIISYFLDINNSPQALEKDTVVFKNGVTGLASLRENDKIEYLIDRNTNKVIYVQVISSALEEVKAQGKLSSVNFNIGDISVIGGSEKLYTYTLAKGLYEIKEDKKYLLIGNKKHEYSKIPPGSMLELTLLNDIVKEIKYIGEMSIINETRGIVIENNKEFGYITFIDNSGNEITMNYTSNDIKVEKQKHYDLEDEIGYIDEVFPNFEYDDRDSVISEIEPGDIIFVRPNKDDNTYVESISAATNYIYKYGKVNVIENEGKYYKILIEYSDKQTTWFDAVNDIFVSEDGKPKKVADIKEGDYVKLLVNQAILAPGYIDESVKEIIIEGNDRFIATVIKGQLAGINSIQKKLKVQNAEKLSQMGWSDYKQVDEFSLSDREIEYYHNSKRISLDYALNYLKRSDGEIYVAIENNYTGNKIKKVTFRDGRDTLLEGDSILNVNPDGTFRVLSRDANISTDLGSIIIRNGRLVTSLKNNDYAQIALNDGEIAAVVNVIDTPGFSDVFIVRGRINSVDEGHSFRVQSISVLDGLVWDYSPVNRDFIVDYNTIYINKEGKVDLKTFLSYTDASVLDKAFNIVVDGTRAAYIVDTPYAKENLRGTIYEITDTEIKLKGAKYLNRKNGKWINVSNKDSSVIVTIPNNSIIAKNNKIAFKKDLVIGNDVRVMTDTLPDVVKTGITVNGYIVLVEK